MSQFYLPKAESEWLKSQEKGYLLGLVRREMNPAAGPPVAVTESPPDAPFVAAKPKLLSGSSLFHPKEGQ